MNASKFWAAARTAVLKVVAFWVLILAAYLALGRQFFPYVERFKPEAEIWLSQQFGTDVQIGQLKGEWVRFNPVVHLTDVTLGNELTISALTLAPGIYESIARGGPSFIRFEVTDFTAELEQTEQGWKFTGIGQQNESPTPIELTSVLELFQRQQKVQFRNTQLSIKPLELPAFDLTLEQGTLSGYGMENGLLANATVHANEVDIPIELQMETTQGLDAINRVYFSHGEIDLTPWLQNLNANISNAVLAGEYWLNLQGEQWQNAVSRINAKALVVDGPHGDIRLNDARLETYVEARSEGFDAWLTLLDYRLNDQAQQQTQAKLSLMNDTLQLQWDRLPASIVGHWFALTDANNFWQSIAPQGQVEQGLLSMQRGDMDSLKINAQVSDFSLQAHQAVPAVSNLAGTLTMAGRSGEIQMSSAQSQVHIANLYDQAFASEVTYTSLRWYADPQLGLLAEGDAQLSIAPIANNIAPVPISLQWLSTTPNAAQKALGREPNVEVQLSLGRMNRDWFGVLADNSQVDPNTAAYLASRLQSGEFTDVQLNYLTSKDSNQTHHSQFFLNADYANASFSFLDNWYALTELNGNLQLTNKALALQVDSGRYPGFAMTDAQLQLSFADLQLQSEFSVESNANEALTFLTSGPLREQIGDTLDSWQAQGRVISTGKLQVPLNAPLDFSIQIDNQFKDVDLSINNIAMNFTDLNGLLSYSTVDGLYAENLELQHENLTQQIQLSSKLNTANPSISLLARGLTPINYWGQRFDDAFLQLQAINIAHETQINITGEQIKIDSLSDLIGFELDFPEPLQKQASQSMDMRLLVDINQGFEKQVALSLDNRLFADFDLSAQNDIRQGLVSFGQPLVEHQEQGVFFDLKIDQADGDAWWRTIQKMRALYAVDNSATPTDGVSFESLIRSISIDANNISYFAQPWRNAAVNLLRNDDAWIIDFEAEEGVGQVLVPHSDEPIFADINWVSLTTGEDNVPFDQAIDPLLAYQPSDVPNMLLQINKLQWNNKDLGAWRAELKQTDGQLSVENIVGEMSGAQMNGSLLWTVIDNKHGTELNGQIKIGNVLDVLNTWQYAPVLTSREGEIEILTAWQGSPAFFDFKRLQGSIDLNLRRGSILQAEEYEGIKLIGLLNFTRVLRRIALDFSDLLREGLTFDSIEGELLFDRGFARVGERLVIDGSATKFQFSGDADLLADELDVDMVLTVPLSSTFPLVALLAGVTPQAAAAIYVTERVFNDELERLSSARMHITGSFEQPKTQFYRVFETGGNSVPATPSAP